MEREQLSVRGLVAFTLHGEDITLGGSVQDMREGALGHRARQAALGEGWRAETPLSLDIPVPEEELTVRLSGRMDAFLEGEPPLVEEIKLWQGRTPPEEALPAHMAQAVVYGHMLCRGQSLDRVGVRVVYVSRSGAVRGVFTRELTAQACAEAFDALWQPWLRRFRQIRKHRRERDASLRALAFPYPAYRPGQREMAVQVYTAIRTGRRLFAALPTGTGKSAAALFPALKALGAGYTGQVYYLTARTTQRQGALDALALMRAQPLRLWTLTLDAKDRQCPHRTVCDAAFCPRAKGHFLRDGAAIEEMLATEDWSPEAIRETADRHQLCPFEFSLSLAELSDLTICDYNYALDPAVHLQRIFDRTADVTLLIDEAHNLPSRMRDMLSGELDTGLVRRGRTALGKALGRRSGVYRCLTAVLRAAEALPLPEGEEEGRLEQTPGALLEACESLLNSLLDRQLAALQGEAAQQRGEMIQGLMDFLRASDRDSAHVFLWQGRREKRITCFALDVATHFAACTQGLRGTVCFSATLHPLPEMKRLLGGGEEDACFSLPSPFPPENLLLLRQDINTRYAGREQAASAIAAAIDALAAARPGRYIAFFPSFAFLRLCEGHLTSPHQSQTPGMEAAEREAFLAPYRRAEAPCLSLCVLGGLFAEGIDLPGSALDGVAVVGVGLPQVNLFQETLRAWYQEQLGDGFLFAYALPGMQKVAQAVGRVIRTETDRGVALLLDDRFAQRRYARLFPPHWQTRTGGISGTLSAFWQEEK